MKIGLLLLVCAGLVTGGCMANDRTRVPAAESRDRAAPRPKPVPAHMQLRSSACTTLLKNGFTETPLTRMLERMPEVKNAGKGDFETTAAYHERLLAPVRADLERTAQRNNGFDIVFSVPMHPAYVKYDADSRLLTLGAETFFNDIVPVGQAATMALHIPHGTSVIRTDFRGRQTGSYLGTNMFGVTQKVTVSKYETFGVIPYRRSEPIRISDWETLRIHYTLRAEPGEAMDAKNGVRALFVGKAVSPYYTAGIDMSTATFSNPRDSISTTQSFVADIECGLLYNAKTRQKYMDLF